MDIALEQFAAATGASVENAARYFDEATAAMERFNIDDAAAVAAFLANVGIETQHLTRMEENLNYSDPKRLAQLFLRVFDTDHDRAIEPEEVERAKAYCHNPQALAKALYDGFQGRGGAMLTWQKNYVLHGDKLGFDYVGQPTLLLQPEHAMLSAASFWDEIKGNEIAANMGEVVLRWNGPKRLALAERIALRDTAKKALA